MDFIYSEINTDLEKVVYTGSSTETTQINVNNIDRTIAVDVKCLPHDLLFKLYNSEDISFNGSEEKTIFLHDYSLVDVTPEGSSITEYAFQKDGVQIGETIRLSSSGIKSQTLRVVEEEDEPYEGALVGEHYLDIVLVDDSHSYTSLKELDSDFENKALEITTNLNTHIVDINNPHSVTKRQVGLEFVDNTSDINKPVSSLQAAAIASAVDTEVIRATTEETRLEERIDRIVTQGGEPNVIESIKNYNGEELTISSKAVTINKAAVGLSNVDNTSDADKPISDAVAEKLDKAVVTGSVITAQSDKVVIKNNKVNIGSDITSSEEKVIPLANNTTAGLMSPSDVQAISNLQSDVQSLKGTALRLIYDTKALPTEEDISEFVLDLGYEEPFSNIAVVVAATLHIWRYYSNAELWVDEGVDTVQTFTNTQEGTIKGAAIDGKVYAENDGTGSVYGWDELNARVSNNESNISTLDDNIGTITSALQSHINSKANPHQVSKSQVGLGNVDNTSDADKPISTATQEALDEKQDILVSGTSIKTINGQSLLGEGNITIESGEGGGVTYEFDNTPTSGSTNPVTSQGIKTYVDTAVADASGSIDTIELNGTELEVVDKTVSIELTKASVGLSNVDNTSDLDKPVSTATQALLEIISDDLDAEIADRESGDDATLESAEAYTDAEITKIKNGTYIADKASKDADGNDITNTYETISNVTSKIATEAVRAEGAEEALDSKITTLTSTVESAISESVITDSSFTTNSELLIVDGANSKKIKSSGKTLSGIASDISSAVATETTARQSADTALGNRITAIEEDYLTSSDKTTLEESIEEEVSGVSTSLSSEVTRATTAEGVLSGRITSLEGTSLSSEEAFDTANEILISKASNSREVVSSGKTFASIASDIATAKSEAISTASSDATSKVNDAVDTAQAYIDSAVASEATLRENADSSLDSRITALSNQISNSNVALQYSEKSNPTAAEINTFVTGLEAGYTSPFAGITVTVSDTKHQWKYYVNESTWVDEGAIGVSIFTNNDAGIILGSTTDGYIQAQSGKGLVSGWSALKDRVSAAETSLLGKQNTLTIDDEPTQSSSNPIQSGAVYSALNGKVDKETGKTLISTSDITKLSGISPNANKVEVSTTNGNIKIDGVDTTVYTLPTSITSDIEALETDKVNKSDIVDNLTSTDATKPLSAKQGKALKDYIDSELTDKQDTLSAYDGEDELIGTKTIGNGIIITSDNKIGRDVDIIPNVDYVDASITSTMNYIDQQITSEHAGRVAGDNLKEDVANKITSWSATASDTKYASEKLVKDTLDTKVDKVEGKVLSSNDFTSVLKTKLEGIAENANNYSLPTATGSTLGGVKIGDGLTITNGVVSVDTQSDNNFTDTLKTKLDGIASGATLTEASTTNGNIKVNGSEVNVYTLPDTVALKSDISSLDSTISADEGYVLTGITQTDGKIVGKTQVALDIPDVSDFITKDVSDLTNYYNKTSVDNLISSIQMYEFEKVSELPSATAETFALKKIFLVPTYNDLEEVSGYSEYICLRSGEEDAYEYSMEKLGDTDIQLADYYNKSTIDALLANKASITELNTKQALSSILTSISQQTSGSGFLRLINGVASIDTTTYLSEITSNDIISKLGFTPYSSANPSEFTSVSASTTNGNIVIDGDEVTVYSLPEGYVNTNNNLTDELVNKINGAYTDKHTHDNIEVLEDITSEDIETWNDTYSTDTVDELLSAKVDVVTGKSLVSDSEIAKLSGVAEYATHVEASTTNGKIKINGVETTVYTPEEVPSGLLSGLYYVEEPEDTEEE